MNEVEEYVVVILIGYDYITPTAYEFLFPEGKPQFCQDPVLGGTVELHYEKYLVFIIGIYNGKGEILVRCISVNAYHLIQEVGPAHTVGSHKLIPLPSLNISLLFDYTLHKRVNCLIVLHIRNTNIAIYS